MNMKKFFRYSTLMLVILILTVSQGFSEQQPQGGFAPLSQEFLEWQKQQEEQSNSLEQNKRNYALPGDSDSQIPGGYIPIPVDLSHLAKNPPKLNDDSNSVIGKRSKAGTIPSKFDLRDVNGKSYVTSVKNQTPYGTCWSFASIGAIESNLLMNGKPEMDLSEMHLAWFAFRNSDKSKAFYNLNSASMQRVLDNGGNSFYSTALFARLGGPVNEEEVPYGKQPSAATPEEYMRVLMLRDAFYISTTEFNINKDLTNRNIIKERIMQNGSVMASYKNDNSAYYTTSENGTSFYSTSGSEGHAIQIIGWDDDYPISAFNKKPSEKGAWLIKNSWGNTWNSGKGDTGCFWMSYKQALTGGTAFVSEEADENMNVYYYDALGWCKSWGYSSGTSEIHAANIFVAERDEKLTEVGFYTPDNNVKYEVSVYTGLSSVSASTPVNGTAVSSGSGEISFAGYHVVPLDTEVSLAAGDVFSVVVKFNGYTYVAVEGAVSGFAPNAKIETGSLFSYNGTTWVTGVSKSMNACIKAFTTTGASKPSITTSYPPDAVLDTAYSYTLTAAGTKPITWSTSGNVPPGLSINSSTGELSGTPTTAGNYTFTVTATNSQGSDSKNFTMNVIEAGAITPTEITGYVNSSMKEQLEISSGTVTKWTAASSLPLGLTLNKSTGAITGKPRLTGTTTVQFTAETSVGDVSENVTFTINEQLVKPKFTTAKLPDGMIDTPYSQEIIASGTEPITFTAEGYPNGLNFDSSTGVLSGTPTEAGTFTIKFTATNLAVTVAGSSPVTKSYKLIIKAVTPSLTPVISLDNAIVGEKIEDYQFTLTAGTLPVTWTASGLPSGLKITSSNDISNDVSVGIISGTPTRAGNFKITVKASNSGGKTSMIVPITVLQKPSITTTRLANGTTDKKYTAKISAKGSAELSWDITGLPDTLTYTLDNNKTSATITGTPTEAESYDIVVKVSNETGHTAEETLSLKINGVAPKLVSQFKTGKVNESYTGGKITATGTKPITITYSISDSDKTKFGITDLSDLGLTFSADSEAGTAEITGTPTLSIKSLPITFTATNVASTTKPVTRTDRLTITGTKPSFVTTTSNYSYTFGDTVDIEIEVEGTKNITITMPSANGLSLTQTGDYTANISGTAPTRKMKMTLKVTASNADGKVTKSIVVQTTASAESSAKVDTTDPEETIIILKYDDETAKKAPTAKTAKATEAAPALTLGKERKVEAIGQDKISRLESEGYMIAAVLPEVSVTESGLYELEVDLEEEAKGMKLFWFAFPKDVEPSEDDEIIEFYDLEGNEITNAPDDNVIAISAWFEEGILYEPVIAVKNEEGEGEGEGEEKKEKENENKNEKVEEEAKEVKETEIELEP